MNKIFKWKTLRILILLIILLIVWERTQLQKALTTSWNTQLDVVIYPINADGSTQASQHIEKLKQQHLESMQRFMSKQSQVYELWTDTPVNFRLDKSITEIPPLPPIGGSLLQTMSWSLKFRWWANKNKGTDAGLTQIQLYVLFYDPKAHPSLPHSTGLQKGLIGIVHAFADPSYNTQNNIITVHELLHTLGATDKYDLRTGLPIHPQGYAEPDKNPRHPQTKTEIMGGQRPVSETRSEMPDTFSTIIIGEQTAQEIGWVNDTNTE